MRVLVVYGSERGGTAGLANMIGVAFTERGWDAQVGAAAEVTSLGDADVVVVGGALYMRRWHRDARRFVRRHRAALRELPVWLFSSGPLDESARAGDLRPVPQVSAIAADVEAKGHMTFGGRLEEHPTGFIAGRMAKTMAGDWRDRAQVREWVDQIVGRDLTDADADASLTASDLVPTQRDGSPARSR